jgi:hypothetical protein
MPFERTDDRRDGVAGERCEPVRVVAVDRFDQCQRGDLREVVGALASAGVALRQPVGQRQVRFDRPCTQRFPIRMTGR